VCRARAVCAAVQSFLWSVRICAGVCRLIANRPALGSFESTPEVKALPSTSVTRLHQYYGLLRLPSGPPRLPRRWGSSPNHDGSPPITRTTFPTCRAHYPGGPRWVRTSVASPSAWAFPEQQSGRRPRVPFRGLLRLHACYGPLDRSAAQWRPLSRGFSPGSCPPKPLVSYQINRQFSGWNLPPLVLRAFGAHCC
jgi:hypothetical protein